MADRRKKLTIAALLTDDEGYLAMRRDAGVTEWDLRTHVMRHLDKVLLYWAKEYGIPPTSAWSIRYWRVEAMPTWPGSGAYRAEIDLDVTEEVYERAMRRGIPGDVRREGWSSSPSWGAVAQEGED